MVLQLIIETILVEVSIVKVELVVDKDLDVTGLHIADTQFHEAEGVTKAEAVWLDGYSLPRGNPERKRAEEAYCGQHVRQASAGPTRG